MKRKINIISVFLIFIGLAISFADLKGWFPNPRMDLANRIMNLGETVLPFDTPYVDELILTFLTDDYPNLNKDNLNHALRDCEGIVIENIILDGHDVMGSVRIQHKDSDKAAVVCGFQDLKNWASSKKYIQWIGWIIALIGAIVSGIDLFIRDKPNGKNKNTQPKTTPENQGGTASAD